MELADPILWNHLITHYNKGTLPSFTGYSLYLVKKRLRVGRW